jgi:hypothetical protein
METQSQFSQGGPTSIVLARNSSMLGCFRSFYPKCGLKDVQLIQEVFYYDQILC